MPPFCQDYENVQELLDSFDSYIPKPISDGDGDISDDLSDVENKMYNKDRWNDTDSDLVSSEYGGNDVVHNSRGGDIKRFTEVQELVKVSLSE